MLTHTGVRLGGQSRPQFHQHIAGRTGRLGHFHPGQKRLFWDAVREVGTSTIRKEQILAIIFEVGSGIVILNKAARPAYHIKAH